MGSKGKGGVLGDKILWVKCPECSGDFYCEHDMVNSEFDLVCPYCKNEFPAADPSK